VSIDQAAYKFARLQPRVAQLAPSKGSTGHRERWDSEDAATIAAAIGYYARNMPRRRLPIMLMLLRYWPEGLRTEQYKSLQIITSNLLSSRLVAKFPTMPFDTKLWLMIQIRDKQLATQLLREFRDPSLCNKCRGLGTVWRLQDEQGNSVPPVVINCPSCEGACTIPMGIHQRSRIACLSWRQWMNHVQPEYTRILQSYENMAGRAARGVMAKMG